MSFFSSQGWQSWDFKYRPVIPEGMPVLVDAGLLFEDGPAAPRPAAVVNRWLRELPASGAPAPSSWENYARRRESADFFAEHANRLGGELAVDSVQLNGDPIPATSIVAVRIAEVVVRHNDLDTAWTIEEADPDSLLNALEAAVRSLRFRGSPGMTLVTEERDECVIGDGALRVASDREGLLEWLAHGDAESIEADGPLPMLPVLVSNIG